MESSIAIPSDISTNLSAALLPRDPPKNKGGAPPSFIWKFFTKLQQYNKKTNRYRAQCNFCQHVIEDGRVENLQKHIMYVCPIASSDVKQYVQSELDKKALEDDRTGKKRKQTREQGQPSHNVRASKSHPINDREQEELDVKLLRLLIMNSLPFGTVENPWMLDFCHSLKPSYVPAGAPKLQTTVLTQEYMKSRAVFIAQLVQKQDVTISVDCWRSNRNQPVYACNVAYSDGAVFLLGAKELSGAADTAENIADDTSTLKTARRLVIAAEGFTHIVDHRCPMHALTLAMCSMLGFPAANALIGNAHMVASRFHVSSAASALLADEARELGINAQLVPCNLSQLQSVHACLVSLVQLEHAIKQMLQTHPDFPIGQEVKACVNSDSFWSHAAAYCKLLAPFADALSGIVSGTSTLANIMVHWLHLAKLLQAAATQSSLPQDVIANCWSVFDQRAAELDGDLCRLALFLDPRYKDVAVPVANADIMLGKARSVFENRRHGEEECDRLSQQLQLYLAGSPPFDKPVLPETPAKTWWLHLGTNNPSAAELVSLAVFMLDMVPHAASVARVGSIMGWYYTPVRSQLDVDTLARVVALKTHLQHHVPQVSKPLSVKEQQDDAGPLLLDIPPLGANPSPDQLMDQLHLFCCKAPVSHSSGDLSQTKLIMAVQYNLDHPALTPTWDVQAPAARGSASLSVPCVNTSEFVRTCFAEMGRKE